MHLDSPMSQKKDPVPTTGTPPTEPDTAVSGSEGVFPLIFLSVCLSVCLFVCLSVFLSVSICLSI